MAKTATLLILGGTAEAASLAEATFDRLPGLRVVTSLAGRTRAPAAVAGETRIGGFGGAAGLEDYLRAEDVDLVIDATHPFAAVISHNAARACEVAAVKRLQLLRPPWASRQGDHWIEVSDVTGAASMLREVGKRAFLTVGRSELSHFTGLDGAWFLIRTIEKPEQAPRLGDCVMIQGRGPFHEASERALMARHRIDVVVAKNSGAAATYAKIAAARAAHLPVIMVRQPPAPPGERAATVDAAMDWLKRHLA